VRRGDALDSISRDPEAALLSPLRASIATETDPVLLARTTRLERLMTMAYNRDTAARVAAINEMAGYLSANFRAFIFLGLFLFIKKRTRLGLEARAVTQNPRMAASMGINPDRVNMLTFGLGSGIAGIAGVAIGIFPKVTAEMGNDYIEQSFMTVVVGGVGIIWGTLAGAVMIASFLKGVEWLIPSNALAAQTYMIIFIIIFNQYRPRGVIALKRSGSGGLRACSVPLLHEIHPFL
jgi:branched-subunit amino acid ABC-type transport system permease component